jgi:hypothetical protein
MSNVKVRTVKEPKFYVVITNQGEFESVVHNAVKEWAEQMLMPKPTSVYAGDYHLSQVPRSEFEYDYILRLNLHLKEAGFTVI